MRNKNKKEPKTLTKIANSEARSNLIFYLLFVIAVNLIGIGLIYVAGALQNLFLGLGTGAFTSAVVSLVFYLNDKEIKKRERLRTRKIFMDDFRVLFHNIIYTIDYDLHSNETMSLEEYIKNQHRWFHEYYKQIVANNTNDKETQKRINQINIFIASTLALFQQCFEYSYSWKEGEYTDWQKTELYNIYLDYKNTQIYLQNNNYKRAFLEFAFLLETLKRISDEFEELKTFNLLCFSYNSNGELTIQTGRFEEKETMFKFAREFNAIREKNYKKYYAKDDNNIHT